MNTTAVCPFQSATKDFRPYYSPELHAAFEVQRRTEPVFWCEEIGYWVLTKHSDVYAVLHDGVRFSAENTTRPDTPMCPEAMAILKEEGYASTASHSTLYGDVHKRTRAVTSQKLNLREFVKLESHIRRLVAEAIERIEGKDEVDLLAEVNYELPAHVVFKLMGIPDADVPNVKKWAGARSVIDFSPATREQQVDGARNMVAFWQYCTALVHDRLPLKAPVAGKGKSGVRLLLSLVCGQLMHLAPSTPKRFSYYLGSLISELGGNLPVGRLHFGGRENLLAVAGIVGGNLRGFGTTESTAGDRFDDLLAAWTGSVQIFLRIASDFRCAAFAGLDLVAKITELICEMRLVDGRRVALRLEEAALLKRPHLTILPLRHIENDDMCMELRRSVAIDRTGCVVLEFCCDKLACHFGRVVAAEARLRVPLQLIESDIYGLLVRFTHTRIAADERGQRNRFRRAEGSVPSGSMLHRSNRLAFLGFIVMHLAVADQLFASPRMLTFRDSKSCSQVCGYWNLERVRRDVERIVRVGAGSSDNQSYVSEPRFRRRR